MPSGTMTVAHSAGLTCAGHAPGAFVIVYDLSKGIQKSYHTSPHELYAGKHVVAVVPGDVEGRKLLARLKYASAHGLTFTVGEIPAKGGPHKRLGSR